MKIALIGAGNMGAVHAGCYSRIEGATLAGVVDVRLEAARSLAEKHGAAAFESIEAMLEAVQPDVVDICAPTPFHLDCVEKVVAHPGLMGIVTEKPMGRTLEECSRMISLCEASGVTLFVAQVVRFFPEFRLAHQKIKAGAIGIPAAVRTRRGGAMPRAWEDWYGDFAMSGGCILDLMIHDFDWLRWTFGEVERVYARALNDAQLPRQDYALVTLRFKSGAIGHVEGTWSDPGGFKVAMEAAGDQGLLEYNFNQPAGSPLKKALTGADDARTAVAIPENPHSENPYQLELAHFLDCLKRGVVPEITGQDGLEAVKIGLAAIESAQTGKPVTL